MFSRLFGFLVVFCVVESRKMVDLTHTFDHNAPKYPLGGFGITDIVYYNTTTLVEQLFGSMWLEFRSMEFYEHMGTHIDAPNHFAKGRQAMHEIPLEKLIGPGVVIDVREKVKDNPNYAVTVQDILDHEKEHGKIPRGAIVIMNSGWGIKYPHPKLTFGTDNLTDPSSFQFPGWDIDACKMLLQERQFHVLGVDLASVDPGQRPGAPCHVYLQAKNVPLLEYVANLDSIPARNTTIVLGPMKVRDGTGGPTRIFALIDENNVVYDSTEKVSPFVAFILTLLFIHFF